MRLTDLRHTSSFRHGLLFLGLFGLGSVLLFGFVYWQTVSFMRGEQDAWLARESASIIELTPAQRALRLFNHARVNPDGMRPFGEFDAAFQHVAGDMLELPAALRGQSGPIDFFMRQGRHRSRFRGQIFALPDGHWLAVAQNVHEPREFQERLVSAMLTAGALTLLLGLLGAIVLGWSAVRHIDAITDSIRRIVTGDLSQRLPVKRGADDLNRLAIAVNGMLDDIERLMHEVKGVCDGIAHDLRTPLTRALGGLERAQRRAVDPAEFQLAIGEACLQIQDLLRTFTAMLRISEIEAGARRIGFVAVDLRQIIDDVLEFYQPLAEQGELSLGWAGAPPSAPLWLQGDPSLLFDALGNVLDNAIKFTPRGGRVTLRNECHCAQHVILISDSGPGIPEQERAAVMSRFYRREPSRLTPGNGLGLSLVAVTARLHGIELRLDQAEPEGGLRVSLSWPMAMDVQT